METCASCGSGLGEGDRFCGECGATVSAPVPGAPVQGSLSRKAESPPSKRSKAWLYLGAVLGAATLFAAGYFVAIHYAVLPTGATSEPAATGSERATGETVPTQDTASEEVPEPAPSVTSGTGSPIEPGLWSFTSELVDVTSADPSDSSFRLEDPGIGRRESQTLCITPEVARDPAAKGFPFGLENPCRPEGLTMRNNRYRGRMACHFDDYYSGWFPVDVDGEYTQTALSLKARVLKPIDGGVEGPLEFYEHHRVEGRRTGPC